MSVFVDPCETFESSQNASSPSTQPRILDSTLREGEQFFGHRLTGDEKVHLLTLLESFGVRLVEIGHPAISAEDLAICTNLVQAAGSAELLVHARATPREIEVAAATGAPWVGVWISATESALKTKWHGRSLPDVLEIAAVAVSDAKDRGLRVRLTVEDASRTSAATLGRICAVAEEGEVDVLSLADTVGALTPTDVPGFIAIAKSACSVPVEVHFHNDFGLALANALTAADAGAAVIDASILGLGERAGIVDLLQLTTVLTLYRGDSRWDLELLGELARVAAHLAGTPVEPHRPLVGAHAWTHVSKYHQDAARAEPSLYEPVEPRIVGAVRKLAGVRPPLGPSRAAESIEIGTPTMVGGDRAGSAQMDCAPSWTLLDGTTSGASQICISRQTLTVADGDDDATGAGAWTELRGYLCPSTLVLLGSEDDLRGLSAEIAWDDTSVTVTSPVSLWVPAKVAHRYRIISGSGEIFSVVLSRYRECVQEELGGSDLPRTQVLTPPWTSEA